MAIRRRTSLIVVGIAALLLLPLIVLGPALGVDRYRPQVVAYLQEKTGKQIEIGRLALTFFPVSIHIDNFGVKNPPIFPRGYVIQVARIDADLSIGALPHQQVVISSLPVIACLQKAIRKVFQSGQIPIGCLALRLALHQ